MNHVPKQGVDFEQDRPPEMIGLPVYRFSGLLGVKATQGPEGIGVNQGGGRVIFKTLEDVLEVKFPAQTPETILQNFPEAIP